MLDTIKAISKVECVDNTISITFEGGDHLSIRAARSTNETNTNWQFDEISFIEGKQYKITIEQVK